MKSYAIVGKHVRKNCRDSTLVPGLLVNESALVRAAIPRGDSAFGPISARKKLLIIVTSLAISLQVALLFPAGEMRLHVCTVILCIVARILCSLDLAKERIWTQK